LFNIKNNLAAKGEETELTKKGKNRILLTQKKEVRPPSKTG